MINFLVRPAITSLSKSIEAHSTGAPPQQNILYFCIHTKKYIDPKKLIELSKPNIKQINKTKKTLYTI